MHKRATKQETELRVAYAAEPIKLEKFLQISTPPKKLKNACYFYNKVNRQGKVHFISYHYSNTIEGNFPEQLLALIDELT